MNPRTFLPQLSIIPELPRRGPGMGRDYSRTNIPASVYKKRKARRKISAESRKINR